MAATAEEISLATEMVKVKMIASLLGVGDTDVSAHLGAASLSKGEAQAGRVLTYLLATQNPLIASHLLPVERFECETRLACGQPDFIAWHNNGSATVIELKCSPFRREVVGGLGQVLMYASEVRAKGHVVQAMLVTVGAEDKHIKDACASAGVSYLALSNLVVESYTRIGRLTRGENG